MEIILMPVLLLLGLVIGYFVGKKVSDLGLSKEITQQQEASKLVVKEKEFAYQALEEKYKSIQEAFQKSGEDLEVLRKQKDLQFEELRNQKEHINIVLEKEKVQNQKLREDLIENKKEIEKIQEKFTKEFENLANKILDEKSKKFTVQNQENLTHILQPLQEKIQLFEKKVENTNKEGIERNATLLEKIKSLNELNQQMSKDAENLTKALKGDSKTQGNWGELILERVLEKSGLEKGREYEMEKSFDTDIENKTRLRPDVIINLPENRKMIVDSKVSLTAYEKLIAITNKEEKEVLIKEHLGSIQRHIEQLSAKNYADLYKIESPDFVLLFVPIEPAFALASENDPDLYNKAFAKNIVIVTPSTLLATLRTIESMWKNEKQQRNALEIAIQAARLYDQFVNLSEDLIKVGRQLKTVQGTYETTMKKFEGRGNLITKVEKLKGLGLKTSKEFNQKLLERAQDEEEL